LPKEIMSVYILPDGKIPFDKKPYGKLYGYYEKIKNVKK
jgi:hypothetical protein